MNIFLTIMILFGCFIICSNIQNGPRTPCKEAVLIILVKNAFKPIWILKMSMVVKQLKIFLCLVNTRQRNVVERLCL